jgi:Uma2 family endonuclease
MDAVTATAQMTAAEFLALPERSTATRAELIDGELVMHQPLWMHGRTQFVIGAALEVWSREGPERGCASSPIDVQLDERNVYNPDIVWYAQGRVPRRDDPRPYPVPDVVVEIRSPSTWRFDIGVKKASYERHGARELWLVDTAADVVLVFRRSRAQAPRFDVSLELGPGETLTSPLLPGFALAVGEIFELDE